MITALISLYTATALLGVDVPTIPTVPLAPVTSAWQDSSILEASKIPEQIPSNIAPVIKAKSAISVDLSTGLILYQKNIHSRLPIGSLTKLMTIILALENNDPEAIMTVPSNINTIQGSKIWLAPGEKISVKNLLYASLINSANDAAYTIAKNNSETLEEFSKKMNKKATQLGLNNTNFTNPAGWDETNNYSSAYDLAILGRYAYNNEFIRQASTLKELEISSSNGKLTHKVTSTNDLLKSYLKVLGLKTGTTDLAGQCLISVVQNDQGNIILNVLLNSPSRYNETKILTDWIFRTYKWN